MAALNIRSRLGKVQIQTFVDRALVANILRQVIRDILKDLNGRIEVRLPAIRSKIKTLTQAVLRIGTMYRGVVLGDLAGHFGFPAEDVLHIINTVVDTIADDITIDFKPFSLKGDTVSGGITVSIIKTTFDEALSLSEATVVTEKNDVLEWLEWTLFRGNDIIIFDYFILLDIGKGRSGLAIMIEKEGTSWSVPPEVASRGNENWISREISKRLNKYELLVTGLVTEQLRKTVKLK